MNLLDIVGEPLLVIEGVKSRQERAERVAELLRLVGMRSEYMQRFPHAFSGGQRQRIVIARALALNPRLVVADEPVSALDVSVQAQVLNLLEDLKEQYGLTLIFIAHDLAVVKNISDRVAVMYLGKLCETAPSDALYSDPAHPYTELLIDSIPIPDPDRAAAGTAIRGEPPSPLAPPSGCRFHPRCPSADDRCAEVEPEIRQIAPDHFVACHHPNITQIELDGAAVGGV